MRVIRDNKSLKDKEIVATIGFFDGVHKGHRSLIGEVIDTAKSQGCPSAVITFSQHPRTVLHADYQPKLLNSFEEKLERLASTGIDYCIVLDFTPGLSRLTAGEFMKDVLKEKWHVRSLVVGYDHRFGYERADGFSQYKAHGQSYGVNVIQAKPYNEGDVVVSSSEIRRELIKGHVEKAAEMLTYPYQIRGHVIDGQKVGRKLGFPTANIQVDEKFKVIPGTGVYAVRVDLEGDSYKGMLYIGDRPTLNNGGEITMEVHILDFSDTIYNNLITVSFLSYIRGDIRFDSLEQLKEQLERDREIVRNYGTIL